MHAHEHDRRHVTRLADERGVALIISLMVMLMLTALGLALTMTTMTETRISGNYAKGTEALYAADAAVERVMQDLLTVPDWNKVLDGTTTSSFIDGPPNGTRNLGFGGQQIDLTEATNMLRCGKITVCSEENLNEFLKTQRPWGRNNPRWQLYAYGPVNDMLPTETVNSAMYVIVWAADDPAENDNNPLVDGGNPDPAYVDVSDPDPNRNPGKGVIMLIAHAYGPGGVRRVIEVTLAKTDTTEIERGYTGQRGQDEQNRRARKAAVQTPGKGLSERSLDLNSTNSTFGQ
jgi:hypothetical protein